ncbi:NADPH-dependent F420 reductase [Microbacterium marinilacus]|uniref:Pyrroline-5-carboxylate reductase catalytic N-terminal domain-containing protein n=1 Tax=Microbacterium marinilacus TaxID=415209 RepID=A0ABP7BSD5_9MICO|nr:NAD(P)-binding domain-containing protein [Microbacterium marinilacus]MBY0689079.1 NAD(P)-binding domain-containing protein [Microbacterium marinilacus]
MSAVTIIGAGNIGGAVAALAAKAGASLQILARDPEKANTVAAPLGASAGRIGDAIAGEIVVLALPYGAVAEVLGAYGADLNGKVLVDVTNPIDFATFDSLVVPADSSAARLIQDAVPDAHVVKAFNANLGATLATGTAGPVPTTVLVAGDDASAKRSIVDLAVAGGLRAVDAGALARARELEALAFLQITLAAAEKTPWTGGFALVG